MFRKTAGVLLLCFVMIAGSACGGGGGETADRSASSAGGDASSAVSSVSSGSGSLSSSSSEEKASDDKYEITLPDTQTLQYDYTSVKGMNITPGTSIAMVVKDTRQGFWKAVRKGAEQAVSDVNAAYGLKDDDAVTMSFDGSDSDADVDGQINTLDAVLAENPTVLCLAAIDVNSCSAQMETASDNGIPVISLDSGVSSDNILATVATDNAGAAKEAASKLCGAIGDSGEIVIVAHTTTAETSTLRINNFESELSENHPNVAVKNVITDTGEDSGSEKSVREQLQQILEADSNVKGIFCTSDVTAEDTLDALKKLDRSDVKVVGFDSGEKQEEAIRSGTETGAVSQNPYAMGYVAVTASLRAAASEEIDTFIDTGYQWLDQTNIDLEENEKYLY